MLERTEISPFGWLICNPRNTSAIYLSIYLSFYLYIYLYLSESIVYSLYLSVYLPWGLVKFELPQFCHSELGQLTSTNYTLHRISWWNGLERIWFLDGFVEMGFYPEVTQRWSMNQRLDLKPCFSPPPKLFNVNEGDAGNFAFLPEKKTIVQRFAFFFSWTGCMWVLSWNMFKPLISVVKSTGLLIYPDNESLRVSSINRRSIKSSQNHLKSMLLVVSTQAHDICHPWLVCILRNLAMRCHEDMADR